MYNLQEFEKAQSAIDKAKLYNDHVDMFLNIIEELEHQNYLLCSQIDELKELVGTDTLKLLKAIENIRDIANELRPLPVPGSPC